MMRVSGPVTPRRLSEDATAALKCGDIDELLRLNRMEFGGFVMMADDAEDEDEDEDDGDGSDDDDGGGDDGGKDDSKSKKEKGKEGSDSGDDDDEESEREKLRKRMKAADKRAAQAERELRELKDKDKPELERAQSELQEVTAERDTLKEENGKLRLQNAFLTSNTHTWHDPDIAIDIARSKKYLEDVVDEDGEVDRKALSKALDRLAKEHGYLVKTEEKKDDDDDDSGPSGESGGGRSDNSKDEKAKKAALRKRFPALNR